MNCRSREKTCQTHLRRNPAHISNKPDQISPAVTPRFKLTSSFQALARYSSITRTLSSTLSHSCALFCTHRITNRLIFMPFRTLWRKTWGGGVSVANSALRQKPPSMFSRTYITVWRRQNVQRYLFHISTSLRHKNTGGGGISPYNEAAISSARRPGNGSLRDRAVATNFVLRTVNRHYEP